MKQFIHCRSAFFLMMGVMLIGCSSAGKYREFASRTAYKIIEEKQEEALGKTEPFTIEPPEVTLRKRLLVDQNLRISHPASMGSNELTPIPHWPDDTYLNSATEAIGTATSAFDQPLKISLIDALKLAASNNRQYQSQKENVFRTALQLDLERDAFRNTFSGLVEGVFSSDFGGSEDEHGIESSAITGLSKQFMNGMSLTTRIGLDLVKLLNPFSSSSSSAFADASISVPLLRGAGKHIEAEPLTQAERNTVYAIYDFERFKREFAVDVANRYLGVLQTIDTIKNQEQNYTGLIRSARESRRKGDAGDIDPIQVDQANQQVLSARESWIGAQMNYERQLDSFKIFLGLPTDAEIELNREDLNQLNKRFGDLMQIAREGNGSEEEEDIPPADAPVDLDPPSWENAGPYELEEELAINLAFENRLDLRVTQGIVYDAQRDVVVAADRLRPELTLLGSASIGERRGLGSADMPDNHDLDIEKGRYNTLLTLDLPFERTSEMVAYRNSIINLEQSVRNLQELEDTIKFDIRSELRNLLQTREDLLIQVQAVALAERRVKSTELYIQAGRKEIRDLLEARESLLGAQNSLTRSMIDYRLAELEIQRDMGVLDVNHEGMWKEFNPKELVQ